MLLVCFLVQSSVIAVLTFRAANVQPSLLDPEKLDRIEFTMKFWRNKAHVLCLCHDFLEAGPLSVVQESRIEVREFLLHNS